MAAEMTKFLSVVQDVGESDNNFRTSLSAKPAFLTWRH